MFTLTLLHLLITHFKLSAQHYLNTFNLVIIGVAALILQTVLSHLYSLTNNYYTVFHIYSVDSSTMFIMLFTGIIAIWLFSNVNNSITHNADFSLILIILLGIFALSASSSILSAIISIELQSLGMYILLGLNGRATTVETGSGSQLGLTYLLSAGAATAILILGLSINSGIIVITSLIWKLGGWPLHSWLMPIVDSVNNYISALILTLTKLGIVVYLGLVNNHLIYNNYILLLSTFNLIIGSIISIFQFRYTLLFSWLSLAQLGYVLLGIGLNIASTAIMYFILYCVYTAQALLSFNYTVFTKNLTASLPRPLLICLIITFFGLAGLPYIGLFWLKLQLLLTANSYILIITLTSTLISSIVYVRIIRYLNSYTLVRTLSN